MTGQNRSSAVMQQRSEPHDSLDDFPTPAFATRALCEYIARFSPVRLGLLDCREPAANRGFMVKPLREYFGHVMASDVHDYGVGFPVQDYLFGPDSHFDRTGWTVTNPPFRLAQQFIERALRLSRVGVAMIVRTAFMEGQKRYEELFTKTPPSHILQFTERVPMYKGRLAGPDETTATAYCWLIWFKGRTGPTTFEWIAPCKKRLARPEDYQ